MTVRILQGDSLAMLKTLPSESVQVCVTSPPYFGLRSYGTNPRVWGGDPEHEHIFDAYAVPPRSGGTGKTGLMRDGRPDEVRQRIQAGNVQASSVPSREAAVCPCGAWRGELGLEPTPSLFIEHLVLIFREVRRVLKSDGTLWCNLGDSYWTRSAMRKGGNREQIKAMAGDIEMDSWAEHAAQGRTRYSSGHPTLKDKDLTLIPQRFAIAMQDDGWWVRSQIAWCKKSAMPESVVDRPTSAWEPIFLFSKSARYFYDQTAVAQPSVSTHGSGNGYARPERLSVNGHGQDEPWQIQPTSSLRNYWLLGPEPSREEHYAAFPTEIPKRCILAGSSQKGQCPACGAPWARVVERNGASKWAADSDIRDFNNDGRTANPQSSHSLHRQRGGVYSTAETTGWQPSCSCPPADPVPQTILDPFVGSGTTLLVASRLGRDGLGIELSEKYVALAEDRIRRDVGPMFPDEVESATTPSPPRSLDLFALLDAEEAVS